MDVARQISQRVHGLTLPFESSAPGQSTPYPVFRMPLAGSKITEDGCVCVCVLEDVPVLDI